MLRVASVPVALWTNTARSYLLMACRDCYQQTCSALHNYITKYFYAVFPRKGKVCTGLHYIASCFSHHDDAGKIWAEGKNT